MSDSEGGLIVLRGGLTVPIPVLRRLWELEDRGLRFGVDEAGPWAEPSELLTDEDRVFLRGHRALVTAVVQYDGEVHA